MMSANKVNWSAVENEFLRLSGLPSEYPGEAIPVVEVDNVYDLGKIVSQRFMEWVHENPNGVVALPTGRTPEFFIKTLEKYKLQWDGDEVRDDLKNFALSSFPDTSNLKFVMLDEFFPMPSTHRNSFCRYIRKYYVDLLGIRSENVLTFDLVSEGVVTSEELMSFVDPDIDIDLVNREPANATETLHKDVLLRVTAYCELFEQRVKDMGGIGFFLGGIGPDGHIAFNQQGHPLDSNTRLVKFNYPSAAQAAGDLGGIELARGKAALTIGLSTITANRDATIIIMAAGEGKASIVKEALEGSVDPYRQASALHGHPGARFYLTHGAACKLAGRHSRRIYDCSAAEALEWALSHLSGCSCPGGSESAIEAKPPPSYRILEGYLYEQSVRLGMPVHELTPEALSARQSSFECPEPLKDALTCRAVVACAARRLREKVECGLRSYRCQGKSILHTAPHHDDIMLSYHGAMHGMLGRVEESHDYNDSLPATRRGRSRSPPPPSARRNRSASGTLSTVCEEPLGEQTGDNKNHFAYLTSGFHSVNESYLRDQCEAVLEPADSAAIAYFYSSAADALTFLDIVVRAGDISRDYDDLMSAFRVAFFKKDYKQQDHIEHVIFLRKIMEVWNIAPTLSVNALSAAIKEKVIWLRNEYLPAHNPGDSIPRDIQILKGCMRETEVDRVWALSRMPMNRIHHLRSKFYTDDFFTPMPSLEDDAIPMANLIRARVPDLLTVAFDPEGTGPDTHYKVLLVVAAGLRLVLQRGDIPDYNPLVWGYRNVWFEFTPSDATVLVPVSSDDLALMHDTFMSCFTTQKSASFPSPYYDGPFSAWARSIQKKQKRLLRTLMGEEYFQNHMDPLVRHSGGFVFLKAMYAREFLHEVEELKSRLEVHQHE